MPRWFHNPHNSIWFHYFSISLYFFNFPNAQLDLAYILLRPQHNLRKEQIGWAVCSQKELHSDLSNSCHLDRPSGVHKHAKFGKEARVKYALTQILSQPRIVWILRHFFHLAQLETSKGRQTNSNSYLWVAEIFERVILLLLKEYFLNKSESKKPLVWLLLFYFNLYSVLYFYEYYYF